MVIFLDMDGVLCDLVRHVYRSLYDLSEAQIEQAYLLTTEWDAMSRALSTVTGREVTDSEMWGRVACCGEEWWARMPWAEDGKLLLEAAVRSPSRVYIASTPTRDPQSASGKMMWLEKNAPALARRFFLCQDKALLAGPARMLFDDNEETCKKFEEAGGESVLWPAPWNSQAISKRRLLTKFFG